MGFASGIDAVGSTEGVGVVGGGVVVFVVLAALLLTVAFPEKKLVYTQCKI